MFIVEGEIIIMRSIPSFNQFMQVITSLKGNCFLKTHQQADPDAIGSLIAFSSFLMELNPEVKVIIPKPQLSTLSQQLIENVQFEFPNQDTINIPSSTIILLDTNSFEDRETVEENRVIIIDHHIPNSVFKNLLFDYQLPEFNSTTEIITCLYYYAKLPIDEKIAKSLLAGIIFDSRRFFFSDEDLFDSVRFLLNSCPDCYQEVLSLTSSSREYSEKIACIKAAQRLKRIMLGEFIFLFSHVSSYEAAAARSLIFLGGDVAVVVAIRDEFTRISLRATPKFTNLTGLSLGKMIVPKLIQKFGGSGGGHDGAAGYNTSKLSLRDVREFIFTIIKEQIAK